MTDRRTAAVSIAIDKVRQRFDRWRSTRQSRRARIPAKLWGAAVHVARQHGLYPMVRSGVRAMSKRPICLAARLPVTPACPYVRT